MTQAITTVTELPADMRDEMRRQINRGLMVAFINADLINRAGLDVRRSIVLYDDAGLFEYAAPELLDATLLQRLYDQTSIRYWSKGI